MEPITKWSPDPSPIGPFNNADPFAITALKVKLVPTKYKIRDFVATFCYPDTPPSKEQMLELMQLPVVACSSCLPVCQARGTCHVGWLLKHLRGKLDIPADKCPELISSAISSEIKVGAKRSRDWSEAAAVHKSAYVDRRAVLLMRKGHPRGVPKLIGGMTSGTSIFANPFKGIPVPLNCALYHRYMEKGFEPLTQAEVDEVVASGQWW